ncbi:MAG TPA: class A beta-lactamase, partial [Azospirillaceae bacterium]|nr:class A beta-lactamase [Azospirillaceae bacterium]
TTVLVGGDRAYPMQSTYKFPIGAAVLEAVDEGRLRLDQPVTVTPDQAAPAHSPLRDRMGGRPVAVTVAELVKLAVGDSDNTASDVLVELLGGTAAVHGFLERHGIRGMRIDRLERDLQRDATGLPPDARPAGMEGFAAAVAALPDAAKRRALDTYLADPRDTATPAAMLDLLEAFNAGRLLSLESMAHLRRVMTDTPTGRNRLRAGTPEGWTLAHKTGTGFPVAGVAPASNDVGILYGPAGQAVAVAVFVAASTAPEAERDRLMAEVARAVTGAPSP